VSAGGSGHIEVVKVTYDPAIIERKKNLDYFWRHINPIRNDGQLCDRGAQYRPAIFYKDEVEKQAILESEKRIKKNKPFKESLKVEFIPASTFYPAEDYHQDYYKKIQGVIIITVFHAGVMRGCKHCGASNKSK